MTYNVVGTSIDVYWYRNTSAGSFTVTVDGGAPSAPVSTAGTSGPNFRSQAFSLGASGAHTVVITVSVASTRIEGIFVYDGDETTGIHLYDDSRSQDGSASRISSGVVSTSTISVWNLVSPDVIFCNLITNDYLSNIDPETTNTNLRLYLAAWKALTKIPSVVFFAAPLPSSTGRTYDYQRYVDIYNDLADENPSMVSVYDARNVSPQATTSGLLLHATDGTHLNNRGQSFIADDFALFTS
jgi:lysophospholipase L1-like esterase